ncbi:MAG TPA: hypothetical protein VEU74_11995 [Gemmatimonadales bacterium]|nr:hypothetical protein [Gemmatimonadales bacterium]
MKTFGQGPVPLKQEPIEFFGGPMDGFVGQFTSPLKDHVFFRNRAADVPGAPDFVQGGAHQPGDCYDVYLLVEDPTGWRYVHQPDAVVGG